MEVFYWWGIFLFSQVEPRTINIYKKLSHSEVKWLPRILWWLITDTGIGSQSPGFQPRASSFTPHPKYSCPRCYMQLTGKLVCYEACIYQAERGENLAHPWNLAFGGEGLSSAEWFLIRLIHQIYSFIHSINLTCLLIYVPSSERYDDEQKLSL